MKIVLNIIGVSISLIGMIVLISLHRYIKQHADEELEVHKSYILSRFLAIIVLEIAGAVLELVTLFLTT